MKRIVKLLHLYCSGLFFCQTVIASSVSIEASGFHWLENLKAFSAEMVHVWKDKGILGKYNSNNELLAINQLKSNHYDIGSILGFCRSYFIATRGLSSMPFMSQDNIRSDAMKVFYEDRVNRIKSDVKVSDEEARKLAFVVCSNVSWSECRRIFGDFLGNRDNNHTLSMGLTHKYTLEEAYIILHIRPFYWFWGGPTTKELEMYTNLIAGALNAVTQGGANSNITLDENFSRKETLKSVIRAFFDKFISKKKDNVRL